MVWFTHPTPLGCLCSPLCITYAQRGSPRASDSTSWVCIAVSLSNSDSIVYGRTHISENGFVELDPTLSAGSSVLHCVITYAHEFVIMCMWIRLNLNLIHPSLNLGCLCAPLCHHVCTMGLSLCTRRHTMHVSCAYLHRAPWFVTQHSSREVPTLLCPVYIA